MRFVQIFVRRDRAGRRHRPGAGATAASARKARKATPDRSQPWLVASPDRSGVAHAMLFRPPGDGPFPLAIIAHASTQNVLRRAQMPQPEYRALASWLVARGYAVLVPERPGHGATGGQYLEDQGGCDEADYAHVRHCHRGFDRGGASLHARASPSSGKTARSLSATPPAAGARWRWPGKTHKASPRSSPLRRGAAATPTTAPTRSARRIAW